MRRALPPHYELRTRPDGLNEIDLPTSLDTAAVSGWALSVIEAHRQPMEVATDPDAVTASLTNFVARFDDAFVADAANVLLWFSGKDLLAGMAGWISARGIANPGAFRAALRDWTIANPARALDLLPEWKTLIDVVRA